jgi:tetratricopeptide (TPR) repeat protein
LLCLPLVFVTTLGLWRYFRPAAADAPWAAAVVTILFALHPAHVEAVVWVSGRKDLLSGMFSLLALYFAVYARNPNSRNLNTSNLNTRNPNTRNPDFKNTNSTPEQGLSPRYAGAALCALLAAMLSKATAVAVAPLIALLWIIFWRDIPKHHRGRSHLFWSFASMLLAGCVAVIFTANSTVKEPFYVGLEAITRALAVLGWMVRLAVSPESRHFIYPVFEDTGLPLMVALGAGVLIASLAGTIWIWRKRTLAGFAGVAFLLLCAPYIQLIPYLTNSLAADRFIFLAVWPVVLLSVAWAWRLKPMLRALFLFLVMLVWGFQTIERPRDWRSEEVLVDIDLRTYPGNYHLAFQKIWAQLREGLYSDAMATANSITVAEFRQTMIAMIRATYAVNTASNHPDEALAALQNFSDALQHMPEQAQWNLPMRHVRDGCRYILALKGARLAKQFPDDALVRYRAGMWKLADHNYKDAVIHLQAAIVSQRLPESLRGQAFNNLGVALLKSGHVTEAEAPLRAAVEQTPPEVNAYCSLAEVYKQAHRLEEAALAEKECRPALEEAPSPGK